MKHKTKWEKLRFELIEMENKAAEIYYKDREYQERQSSASQMKVIVSVVQHIRVLMDRFEKESRDAYLQRKMPKV